MKSNQHKTVLSPMAQKAMQRAKRKGWCKQQAQQEIERQRAIEAMDLALVRDMRAWI